MTKNSLIRVVALSSLLSLSACVFTNPNDTYRELRAREQARRQLQNPYQEEQYVQEQEVKEKPGARKATETGAEILLRGLSIAQYFF